MSNFGIGFGAFVQGFERGMGIGKQYKAASKEYEGDKLREKLMEEATKARNEQIEAETARLTQGGIGDQPKQAQGAAAIPADDQAPKQGQAQAFPVGMSGDTPPTGQQAAALVESPIEDQAAPAPAQQMAPEPAPVQPAPAGPAPAQMPQSGAMPPAPQQQEAAPQQPAPARPFAAGIEAPTNLGMTPEQARKLAEKSAPTVIDIFQKQGVPKIAEFYLKSGDPEKAEAWLSYADTAESKKNMASWSKAWRATQLGNIEGAADHFFDLYKSMDDSVTLSGKEVVKDKEGNITGFNVKMRDKASGEKRAVFVDREQLLNMGLTALSPPKMFEAMWARETASQKARTDAAAEVGKINMQAQKEIAVEGVRQQGRVALEDHKAQQPGLLGKKIADMRREGATPEQIQGVMNAAALADDAFKKGASPQEAKRQIMTNLSKQYVDYAGRPTKTPQEIAAEADEYIKVIYAGGSTAGAPGEGAPAGNVGSLGQAARGLPVLDTKTGKVVYR